MLRNALKVKLVFGLVLALAGAAVAQAQSAENVAGMWLNAAGNGGILIAPCGQGQLCGTIAWTKDPVDPKTGSKFDILNPNTALRTRLLCGLQILGDFKPRDDGSWGGGWIYDPDSGNTYSSHMRLGDDGKLHVRGFIGISLLGRTEVWTRPTAPLPPCMAH